MQALFDLWNYFGFIWQGLAPSHARHIDVATQI